MKSEIKKLIKEARHHYIAHQQLVSDMSCGASLAAHIRTGVGEHAAGFNKAMERLREIDRNCPPYDQLPV